MPSTLGELRIEKQPRQHPGKVVAGRAACEEALETSSVLCFQPFYTLVSTVTLRARSSSFCYSLTGVLPPNSGSLRSILLRVTLLVLQRVSYLHNGNTSSPVVSVPILCLPTASAS